MYHNLKFFIIWSVCLWFWIFLYQFDIFDKSFQNDTANQNYIKLENSDKTTDTKKHEIVEDEGKNQVYTQRISEKNSDENKEWELKDKSTKKLQDMKYFSDFEYTLIKFPDILEYPDLLQDFLKFKENNANIRPTNIDLNNYEWLLDKLLEKNLLIHIWENNFWAYKWKKYAIFWNKDYIEDDSINKCGLHENFWACFTTVNQHNAEYKYIFSDTWKIKTYSHNNKKYVLSQRWFGSGCASVWEYILYDFDGTLINKVSELVTWCYWLSKHGLKKWNQSFEFVQYTREWDDFESNRFSSIEISDGFDLKENILYEVWNYDFDIYENLFNWAFIDVNINGQNKRFSQKKYPEDKKISHIYQDDVMLELLENDIWFTVEWTFLREKNIDTISVKNCKENNSDLLDDYYTLNKYKIWDEKFQYNISKKYWNYCEQGRYIFRLESVDNKEIIAEIKIYFDK